MPRLIRCAGGFAGLVGGIGTVLAAAAPLAPGYSPLPYALPGAGSYGLPMTVPAADGAVLDTDGNTTRLHALMGDKIVLLSFIYASCNDVNGCPLAIHVFHSVQAHAATHMELAEQLRLLTISFDPIHDTPENLRNYVAQQRPGPLDWRFFTTRSLADLQPILRGYDQTIRAEYDAEGHDTGTFSHLLRVYLIDRQKRIRNVYTVSFLHATTLLNDVQTLLRETAASPAPATPPPAVEQSPSPQPSPLGLPALPIPPDNPMTADKIQLGHKLFFDRRLSFNETQSCAMCHIPEQGFTSNQLGTAVGLEGRTVRRNAPSLYNVAYQTRLFHDGRETTLEQQIWSPLLAHNEMGNPSVGYVLEKLRRMSEYRTQFQQVFARDVSMETLGQALAAYQRTLNAGNSPFDRWRYGGQHNAMGADARAGFTLFTGKAGCSACHTVGADAALFTDQHFHDTGLGYRDSVQLPAATQPVQLAPGLMVNLPHAVVAAVSAPAVNDLGRYEITQDPVDRWKFKTPSLRNVALTAPYMHNGSLPTLAAVIDFYSAGGVAHPGLDSQIRPLRLGATERRQLIAFLHALTSADTAELVARARAAPIGNRTTGR